MNRGNLEQWCRVLGANVVLDTRFNHDGSRMRLRVVGNDCDQYYCGKCLLKIRQGVGAISDCVFFGLEVSVLDRRQTIDNSLS